MPMDFPDMKSLIRAGGIWKFRKPGEMNKLRLLLRSVYLKGHQDGNEKTCDMSWEDKIVKDINKLFAEKKGLTNDPR